MTTPTTAETPKADAIQLKIELRAVSDLKPFAGNARTHSKKQIAQIAAAIRQFGFNNPVLIDQDDGIIAGHGRVEAAKLLKLSSVPTIRLAHMSEAERRAYIIADNRLAEKAGWDDDILKIELQFLVDQTDLTFDVEITGFETAQLDLMLDGPVAPKVDAKADQVIEPAVGSPVSRPGDHWRLGDHRLLCGDATRPSNYAALMCGELARMAFTDPPYNVPIAGHVGGAGKTQHREFVMASGEMTQGQFTTFLHDTFANLRAVSVDGAIHFHCMDWRHIAEIQEAGGEVYEELKNLLVWVKDNAGMGTFYRSQHELIFAYKVGTAAHTNTFELGQSGRYRSNVLHYPGVNKFKTGAGDELGMHPTVKPVAMVADLIRDVSRRGEIVIDAFGGSGSTLIAAQKTKRRARLLELDPIYVDVICRRFEAFTGQVAVHAETGQTFDEAAAERLYVAEEAA